MPTPRSPLLAAAVAVALLLDPAATLRTHSLSATSAWAKRRHHKKRQKQRHHRRHHKHRSAPATEM